MVDYDPDDFDIGGYYADEDGLPRNMEVGFDHKGCLGCAAILAFLPWPFVLVVVSWRYAWLYLLGW